MGAVLNDYTTENKSLGDLLEQSNNDKLSDDDIRYLIHSSNELAGQMKDISCHVEYDLAQGDFWGDQRVLFIAAYNEDAYYYFNSVSSSNNIFNNTPGSEPVPIYSNIENGIGIFAGASVFLQNIEDWNQWLA